MSGVEAFASAILIAVGEPGRAAVTEQEPTIRGAVLPCGPAGECPEPRPCQDRHDKVRDEFDALPVAFALYMGSCLLRARTRPGCRNDVGPGPDGRMPSGSGTVAAGRGRLRA